MFLCILQMVNAILTRRGTAAPRGERAAALVLDGIKRNDWRARPDAARKLGAVLAERGEIAYWVVTPESDLPVRMPNLRPLAHQTPDHARPRRPIAEARGGAYRRIGRRGLCESRPALRARRRRAPSRADVCAPS